ncbi:MAG: PDZ domain-containing protein [Acidobacteria bacterium]|nr:PDZ domain-containing protein [Acidobacteriota bacterium]
MKQTKMDRCPKPTWLRWAPAGIIAIWLGTNLCPAQAVEPGIWPRTASGLWYWVAPQTDLAAEKIEDAFKRAVSQGTAFISPEFPDTVFFAKKIRITAGKAKKRKGYKDQPTKADDLRIEAEWQTGYLNQYRGATYHFIALDAVRGLDLHFLTIPREHFPKAPDGRNWNVNVFAGIRVSFFFALEETARAFVNAVASAIGQRGLDLTLSRFGLMWENVTPAQAADMGSAGPGRDGRAAGAGVLVTRVAVAGPADRAGIRPLDAVLAVNGVPVKNFSHFSLLLDGIAPGATMALLLLRRLKPPDRHPEPSAWETLTVEMEAR